MNDEPYRFYTRQEIADYLGVTRVTIYRWEKIVPLHHYGRQHLRGVLRSEVIEWVGKVKRSGRYRPPNGSGSYRDTSRRRNVSSARPGTRYRKEIHDTSS